MTKEILCIMCNAPTVDQWGGYCHDCDNYMEAVIGQNMEHGVVKEINPS